MLIVKRVARCKVHKRGHNTVKRYAGRNVNGYQISVAFEAGVPAILLLILEAIRLNINELHEIVILHRHGNELHRHGNHDAFGSKFMDDVGFHQILNTILQVMVLVACRPPGFSCQQTGAAA